ncbi:glycosyltransferase family 61 protein [Methylobacterium terricola]|uniref:Glycosyltransferase family 61 protein n=1 Tax=Methylobacterium terricola TaxID=2583531 RepID=A0A5C4LAW4_9HYPH|nr:glycosyltransferase family 61 protein [Methylobacterium terricola]TNC09409.1 glycosyltransferase family 61 protein [Methylobacterium terricola]
MADGPFAGLYLQRSNAGITISDGSFYFCAAPDRQDLSADRERVGEWETFTPVSEAAMLSHLAVAEKKRTGSPLVECDMMWGQAKIIASDPSVTIKDSCIYLPFTPDGTWGLFNTDGSPELDAFGNFVIYRQSTKTNLTADSIKEVADITNYMYVRYFNCHFGHFLVDTLPRLWMFRSAYSRKSKLLCHSDAPPSHWFRFPYIAEIMGRLGLTPDNFDVLDRPTRLRNVIIPRTSLLPQNSAHRCYAHFARDLFRDVLAGTIDSNNRPIYYSKTRLSIGVGCIANELEIEENLASRGVEIVYPETLPIVDQVKLMSERRFILGTAGSFLHASVFCPPRHMNILSMKRSVNANYHLIDRICESRTKYLYSPEAHTSPVPRKNFGEVIYMPNAPLVAKHLYDSLSL